MRKLTVKSMTNPYNSSEAKNKVCGTRCVIELCNYHWSYIRGKNWIATTRGAPCPHIANGHSLFLVSIGVVGAIDKQLIIFLDWNKNQLQIYIWPDRYFTSHPCKKTPKNWLKNTLEKILELNSPQERERISMTIFAKKQFYQNSNKRLGPEESQKS